MNPEDFIYKREVINLIHIGDRFYAASGTRMSSLYQMGVNGPSRYDWGLVNRALEQGHEVRIRPANEEEMAWAENLLAEIRPSMPLATWPLAAWNLPSGIRRYVSEQPRRKNKNGGTNDINEE